MTTTTTLGFDTGLVHYEINGVKVSFNPTDEGFVRRLQDAFAAIEGVRESPEGEGGDVFALFAERDKEMRGIIDGLLGDGIADALFPGMNCYALANGLPVCANLLLLLLDEVGDAYERELDKADESVAAHSERYKALMAKYGKDGRKARR